MDSVIYATILSIITFIVMVVVEKIYNNEISYNMIYVCVALYMLVPFIIHYAIKQHSTITVINNLWSIISIILVSGVSYFWFKKDFGTYKKIGTLLTIVALVMYML